MSAQFPAAKVSFIFFIQKSYQFTIFILGETEIECQENKNRIVLRFSKEATSDRRGSFLTSCPPGVKIKQGNGIQKQGRADMKKGFKKIGSDVKEYA